MGTCFVDIFLLEALSTPCSAITWTWGWMLRQLQQQQMATQWHKRWPSRSLRRSSSGRPWQLPRLRLQLPLQAVTRTAAAAAGVGRGGAAKVAVVAAAAALVAAVPQQPGRWQTRQGLEKVRRAYSMGSLANAGHLRSMPAASPLQSRPHSRGPTTSLHFHDYRCRQQAAARATAAASILAALGGPRGVLCWGIVIHVGSALHAMLSCSVLHALLGEHAPAIKQLVSQIKLIK